MLFICKLHATVGDKPMLKVVGLAVFFFASASAMAVPYAGIPAKYHGRYDATLASCRDSSISDMELKISATTMQFYESTGTVKSVLSHKDGSITVLSEFEGEGEKWTDMDHLRISADGKILTITNPARPELKQMYVDRVRCPNKQQKK